MKKDNILILCHELSPVGGGAGNFTHYLAHDLNSRRYFSNIIVITSNYKSRFSFLTKDNGILIFRLPILRRHIDRTSPLNLAIYAVFAFVLGACLNLRYRFKFSLVVHGIPAGWTALAMLISQGASDIRLCPAI